VKKRLILYLLLPFLAGCSTSQTTKINASSFGWGTLDAQLPNGSSATPPHALPRHEYPFDSNGNYIASWALAGEKLHGRKTSSRPSSSSHGTDSRKIGYRRHRIVSGDTLYGLARKYGTSVSAIKRANNLRSDLIIKGRTLKIP
jgi:LysM repeat protein